MSIGSRLLALFALLLWPPPSAMAQPVTPELAAKVDALFSAYDRTDTPGYVVGVVTDGELVWSRAYGMADLDHGVPLSTRTPFHLASVSKQFTGAAAALLILDGRLSLSDPVAKWVPAAAKFGPDLRVEHLVYMTSGLPEYWDRPRPGGAPWHSFHLFDNDDMLASVLGAERLDFAPGTKWRYTNSNYLLLAKVAEAASGKPLSAFLQERVFGPLGMTTAQVNDDPTLIVPGRATGYVERGDLLVGEGRKVDIPVRGGSGWARLMRVSPHYGGSGVFASLDDLVRWDRNWYSEKVGRGFTALMHRRAKFPHGKDDDAFGLVRDDRYGLESWAYSGSDLDTSTYMARFPTKRLTVICLSNMPTGEADGKCRRVLDLMHEAGRL
jgi:CubicO group peptidase (beta-lactamase class C family)